MLLFSAQLVSACVVGPLSPLQSLESNDLVFTGTLEGCFVEENQNFAQYVVQRIWKGDIKRKYKRQVTHCGKELQEMIGRRFIIYAKYVDNSDYIDIQDGRCERTRPLLHPWKRLLKDVWSDITGVDYGTHDIRDLGPPIHIFKK